MGSDSLFRGFTGFSGRDKTWKKKPSKSSKSLSIRPSRACRYSSRSRPVHLADPIIAVIGNALSVGHQGQEEIEQQFMMVECGPESFTQETMFDKGETALDFTDTSGVEKLFFDHNDPLEDDFNIA